MQELPTQSASDDFWKALSVAKEHIERQVQGQFEGWLYSISQGPSLHHLAFRLGNQLFVGRLVSESGELQGPADPDALMPFCDKGGARAFVMPMHKILDTWTVDAPGWGLLDAASLEPIDPVALLDDSLVEMSDYELQDFAVQVVLQHLQTSELDIISVQTNPEVDPGVWFNDGDGRAWIIVRAARYPNAELPLPGNVDEIRRRCSEDGSPGYFASIVVANSDDAFAPDQVPPLPLYRGHGMVVRFQGLQRI